MVGTSSSSPLRRWTALAGCIVLCATVAGASSSKSGEPSASRQIAVAPVTPAISTQGNGELLHAVSTKPQASAMLASASIPALTGEHHRVVWMVVTAYCGCTKCCGPHAQGITASGRSIQYNGGCFVAADTHLFKFGTRLRVPGYAEEQPVEVIDRGGAIKGYRLDVFFPSHEQARQWGRRWVPVTVVDSTDAMN